MSSVYTYVTLLLLPVTNMTNDKIAYIAEIAYVFWAIDYYQSWDITPDKMLLFYLAVYEEASKNKTQSLLQSCYDVIEDKKLTRELFLQATK